MKHIKDFKLYESAVAKEKYIYILSDRDHYDSFDKRVKKLTTPDIINIYRVGSNGVGQVSTAFYQSSKLGVFSNLSRELSRNKDRVRVTDVDNMVKFAKRSAGCIVKEFNTLQELESSLEVNKHITNFRELSEVISDISDFIKTLRKSEMTSRKTSYRNHLLINNGNYTGKEHLIIDANNNADFRFTTHYSGTIKIDDVGSGYYSAYNFLTHSNYRDSSNSDYSLHHINKGQQTHLKNLANSARSLFLEFSKEIVETFKNPK